MSDLGRVIVGYRLNDRRRLKLVHEHGVEAVAIRRCLAGCGYDVYILRSNLHAVHEKDPEVVCDDCYQAHRHEIEARL